MIKNPGSLSSRSRPSAEYPLRNVEHTHLYALADEEIRVLILIDLLQVKTILEHYVIDLSKRSLEGVISDI